MIFFLLLAVSDYSAVNRTFQLNPMQLMYNFTITIENDDVVEVPEEFSLHLTRVTQEGRVTISPALAIVSIADNDGK